MAEHLHLNQLLRDRVSELSRCGGKSPADNCCPPVSQCACASEHALDGSLKVWDGIPLLAGDGCWAACCLGAKTGPSFRKLRSRCATDTRKTYDLVTDFLTHLGHARAVHVG